MRKLFNSLIKERMKNIIPITWRGAYWIFSANDNATEFISHFN